MPAGTGVWVVKTLLARAASRASSKLSFCVAHVQADLFQREEGGVAFVHVEDGGLETHRLQGAHAADAEHDLLADARIDIAAVERIGDIAILRQHVFRDVGVEQVERDAADVELPDLNEDVAGGQFDGDLEIVALGVLHGVERQRVEIVHRIAFLLPSVGIQKLAEVALLIEQPEPISGIILVAGRLQMVAGENAEAARIDRQALGEAVFRGEIGDQLAVGRRGSSCGRAHRRFRRRCDRAPGSADRWRPSAGWPGKRGPASARDCIRTPARCIGIEAAKQGADDGLPTPHDVVGQLGQTGQRVGQTGADQKFAEWLNVKRHTRVELTFKIADWPL